MLWRGPASYSQPDRMKHQGVQQTPLQRASETREGVRELTSSQTAPDAPERASEGGSRKRTHRSRRSSHSALFTELPRNCLENAVSRVTGAYAPHHGEQKISNRPVKPIIRELRGTFQTRVQSEERREQTC